MCLASNENNFFAQMIGFEFRKTKKMTREQKKNNGVESSFYTK